MGLGDGVVEGWRVGLGRWMGMGGPSGAVVLGLRLAVQVQVQVVVVAMKEVTMRRTLTMKGSCWVVKRVRRMRKPRRRTSRMCCGC